MDGVMLVLLWATTGAAAFVLVPVVLALEPVRRCGGMAVTGAVLGGTYGALLSLG